MDSDRLVRQSFPGILFFVYLAFFYLMITGNFENLNTLLSGESILKVIGIVVTTPVIGFIISTLTMGVLELVIGYHCHYGFPTTKILTAIFKRNPNLQEQHKLYGKPKTFLLFEAKQRAYLRDMYIDYMILRQEIEGDKLKFLARRWNIYWVHLFNIAAILLALVIAFIVFAIPAKLICIKEPTLFIIGSIVTFIYIVFAMSSSHKVKWEAIRVERGLLEDELKNKPK